MQTFHSFLSLALALTALPSLISAQQSAWGQCGGNGYTGSTSCVSGYYCSSLNEWYSQCVPGTATTTVAAAATRTAKAATTAQTTAKAATSSAKAATSSAKATTSPAKAAKTIAAAAEATTAATTTSTASSPSSSNSVCSGSLTKFTYFGVNEAGAEFGNTNIPGTLGTDYTWPTTDSIDYFIGKGMNTFRIGFLMDRMSPPANGLTGDFDSTYLASLKEIATYVTGKGAHAILNPHNFGRYNGSIISDYTSFGTWCQNLASEFKSDSNIIFDTNNEYHDMDQTLVFNLNQACINGIRAAGATTQLILVEGNSYTGAWTWVSSGNSDSLIDLVDPNDNMAYEMHQYLDSDGSGTSETCVSSTIGKERLEAATSWLQENGKKGFLGEIGAGSNDDCITAVQGALCSMQQADGVWIGALWWAAGPWWGTYYQSIEPPSGPAIERILPEALLPFA